jgi:hypothetical protein
MSRFKSGVVVLVATRIDIGPTIDEPGYAVVIAGQVVRLHDTLAEAIDARSELLRAKAKGSDVSLDLASAAS